MVAESSGSVALIARPPVPSRRRSYLLSSSWSRSALGHEHVVEIRVRTVSRSTSTRPSSRRAPRAPGGRCRRRVRRERSSVDESAPSPAPRRRVPRLLVGELEPEWPPGTDASARRRALATIRPRRQRDPVREPVGLLQLLVVSRPSPPALPAPRRSPRPCAGCVGPARVGSSRNTTRGSLISVIASRAGAPCRPSTSRLPGRRHRPGRAARAGPRRAAASARSRCHRSAIRRRFSRPVSSVSTRELAGHPDRGAMPSASVATSWPATVTVPARGVVAEIHVVSCPRRWPSRRTPSGGTHSIPSSTSGRRRPSAVRAYG